MTRALLDRLRGFYDESWAATIIAGSARWPPQHVPVRAKDFGVAIGDVKAILPHMTAGWPSRGKAQSWVDLYTTVNHASWGIGPSLYVSNDGTVARLMDLPRVTWHGEFVNAWSIGIEIGNLGDQAPPPGERWRQLNQDAATQAADDIPGARAWVRDLRDAPREVVCSWWTTERYAGPKRGPLVGTWMLFSEWQYRSLALACRYLAEEHRVPRNVPLLPHTRRSDVLTVAEPYRRIVLADPARAEIAVAATPAYAITTADFEPDHAATLQARYAAPAAIQAADGDYKRHNKVWREMFSTWRGFHGHGYAGAIGRDHHDHDCPGPLFDWHRFAREISDFWWLPFDVDATGSTATPRRAYQNPDAATPVVEYYFDENELLRIAQIRTGVHGAAGSPETFTLDPRTPVYAMANGELVAARIAAADPNHASTSFVLVRHEVFHRPHPVPVPMLGWVPGVPVDTLDHGTEPHYVYTLYMHLGRRGGVNLDAVSPDNPDWLNRVLVRKRECDLGLAFYDHPQHHGIPDAAWNQPLPGAEGRSTLRDAWALDQLSHGGFLEALGRGEVAVGPPRDPNYHPIRVLLGDYLGHAGIREVRGGASTHGVRVEAFSPFLLPGFSAVMGQSDWSPPSGLPDPPALFYQSEWARTPTTGEAAQLTASGFDPSTSPWWDQVALATAWADTTLPVTAQLPANGFVWHYRALDVARWLNALTWRHERTKFRSPTAAAMPRPPSRRV